MEDKHITWSEGVVTTADREQFLGQKATVLWFTGLSGSGKSTIAIEVERQLLASGKLCYRLDGDNIRHGLNQDLGFSLEDRRENIRRIAHVASLMRDSGLVVLVTFISPTCTIRRMAEDIIGQEYFQEVYVKANVEACKARDPKGLYKKALTGEIADFTGISSPYEAPIDPALTLDTEHHTVEECAKQVVQHIRNLSL